MKWFLLLIALFSPGVLNLLSFLWAESRPAITRMDYATQQIIQPLIDANTRLARSDPHFKRKYPAAPKFKNGEQPRTYDYVVANPPFSDKTCSTDLMPSDDPFQRFQWGRAACEAG